MLQGAAADCNSAEATHAWFDSKIAHQFADMKMRLIKVPAAQVILLLRKCFHIGANIRRPSSSHLGRALLYPKTAKPLIDATRE